MKAYGQLMDKRKAEAVDYCLNRLLRGVIEGGIRFRDELNHNDLQAKIDKAREEAERMFTPWFVHEYIMEAVGEELRSMATADAEDALYADQGEDVISLPP